MSRLLHRLHPLGFAVYLCPGSADAGPITIDFEALADLSSVGTFYPGVTFSNATVLETGISLNESEYPPQSGTHVVFDDGDAVRIDFASSIFGVSGFFTYSTPITLTAFDTSNNVLAVASA